MSFQASVRWTVAFALGPTGITLEGLDSGYSGLLPVWGVDNSPRLEAGLSLSI